MDRLVPRRHTAIAEEDPRGESRISKPGRILSSLGPSGQKNFMLGPKGTMWRNGCRREEHVTLKCNVAHPQAQAFARQHNKPELSRVLLPRTKGFVSTIQGLRGSHVKHVYDLTLLYLSEPSRSKGASVKGSFGIADERERVPTLSEHLGCADIARTGYRFRIHVRR